MIVINTVLNLASFRKDKKIQYERDMLKDFSLETLGRHYRHLAKGLKCLPGCSLEPAEDHCYDIAVEAFLLGAAYSKFSRYGEPIEKIKERSQSEIRMLTNQLFHYLIQPVENVSAFIEDTLYYLSDEYVMIWWLEGYSKGKNRLKLRFR